MKKKIIKIALLCCIVIVFILTAVLVYRHFSLSKSPFADINVEGVWNVYVCGIRKNEIIHTLTEEEINWFVSTLKEVSDYGKGEKNPDLPDAGTASATYLLVHEGESYYISQAGWYLLVEGLYYNMRENTDILDNLTDFWDECLN